MKRAKGKIEIVLTVTVIEFILLKKRRL